MTASELKYLYEGNNPDGPFFSRGSMRFFGDRMRNYGVWQVYIMVEGVSIPGYCLHRKRPVRGGLQTAAFFDLAGKHLPGQYEYAERKK